MDNENPRKKLKISNINTRVESFIPLTTPSQLREEIKISSQVAHRIDSWRNQISDILSGKDKRLLVIVGPCSIHDSQAALIYAKNLQKLSLSLPNLFIVMRAYLQKPRTSVGWTGILDDPTLDGSYNGDMGIRVSRSLLLKICQVGLPIATEFLGTTLEPQYIADLISWGCIGARTVESQVHRHLVSGLSMPVGFKNASDGNLKAALCACICASTPRSFIGIDDKGVPSLVKTKGNNDLSIVLRGSYTNGPNDHKSKEAQEMLLNSNLVDAVIVDAAHGNSGKTIKGQIDAIERIKSGIIEGNVRGIMIESFLEEGSTNDVKESRGRGISITDPCIGWENTDIILNSLNKILK